jgi:hypothetical protein
MNNQYVTTNSVGSIVSGSKVVYNGITYDVGAVSKKQIELFLNNKYVCTISTEQAQRL